MSETTHGLRTADIVALGAASLAVGVTVSAIMVDIGTSGAVVMAATVTAFSGSGELAYAAVILSGGSTAAALEGRLSVRKVTDEENEPSPAPKQTMPVVSAQFATTAQAA